MQLMLRGRRSERAAARADEYLMGEFAESSSGAVCGPSVGRGCPLVPTVSDRSLRLLAFVEQVPELDPVTTGSPVPRERPPLRKVRMAVSAPPHTG